MKKLITLIAILLILSTLFSCTKQGGEIYSFDKTTLTKSVKSLSSSTLPKISSITTKQTTIPSITTTQTQTEIPIVTTTQIKTTLQTQTTVQLQTTVDIRTTIAPTPTPTLTTTVTLSIYGGEYEVGSEFVVKYQKNWYTIFHSCIELSNGNILVVGEISKEITTENENDTHITQGLIVVLDPNGNIIKEEIHEEYYTIAQVQRNQDGGILLLCKRSELDGLIVLATFNEFGEISEELEIVRTENCWPHHFFESIFTANKGDTFMSYGYSIVTSMYHSDKLLKYSSKEFMNAYKYELLYGTINTVISYTREGLKLIHLDFSYEDEEKINNFRLVSIHLKFLEPIYYYFRGNITVGYGIASGHATLSEDTHSISTRDYSGFTSWYHFNSSSEYNKKDNSMIIIDSKKDIKKGAPIIVEFYNFIKQGQSWIGVEDNPYSSTEYQISNDYLRISSSLRDENIYYITGIESVIDEEGSVTVGSFIIKSFVP